MGQYNSWLPYIGSYLKGLNDQYDDYCSFKQQPAHLLFLESQDDLDFYKTAVFLKEISTSFGKNNLLLDGDDHYIVPFGSTFELMVRRGMELDGDKESNAAFIPNRGSCVQFIIECIRKQRSIRKYLASIDCYGFIDRDFNHNIEGLVQISETSEHDIETNLMRYCMPEYINMILKEHRGYAVDKYSAVLYSAFQQGILEETSFEFEDGALIEEEYLVSKVKDGTHGLFKKKKWKELLDFDFDSYVKSNPNIFNERFISIYESKKRKAKAGDKATIINVIKKWLLNMPIHENDIVLLENALKYTNGHIFINCLLYNDDKKAFNIHRSTPFWEREFTCNLKEIAKNKLDDLYKLSPLPEYITFRESKGYFYK